MSRCYPIVVWVAGLILAVGDCRLRAAEPAETETAYYLGESKMTTADGKPVRTSLSLVKRVVKRKDGRIEEHVLSLGEKESKAFVVTLEVKDTKFTVSEKSGAFSGSGELVGEAWKWAEWKSVTKLAGGAGTVTSEDKLTDRGLSARKTFTDKAGATLHFDEGLAPISQKTYEILYARLAPAEKK